jgi:hypothetical protein
MANTDISRKLTAFICRVGNYLQINITSYPVKPVETQNGNTKKTISTHK